MRSPADPEALLSRIEWTVIRRLDGLLQGNYRTLFQGMGLDFADLRPYQWGDDVRTIDWSVTARLTEAHVRRFHEDRDVRAWFLIDTSASLEFGTDGTKRDGAVGLVAALATLLVRGGNRIGACLYDGGLPRLLPASAGRPAVLSLLRALQTPPAEGIQPETDLSVLLEAMEGVLRRRSLLFLLSDFQGPSGWVKSLGRLTQRHEVMAIRLADRSDAVLPDVGVVWMEDAETGRQLLVDTSDPAVRRRYRELETERTRSLQASFRRSGTEPHVFSTGDDVVRTLLRWSDQRRHRPAMRGAS